MERFQQFVRDAFDDSHSSFLLILKITEGEGHRAALAVHFREESTRSFHFQHVCFICPLENSGPCFHLTTLQLHINIAIRT